ncbi:MAG: hypothetical protein HN846_00225 [Candidatus Pacebacteria bacterium]|jgi:hypothetical protein|nr:hypothetical protein [Candidatus Paceibacterota bacterium]MBT7183839.1 hypothetical protein [Candidatus Paceibacterota bacterium]MBT7309133.1 hypothetical protein [Candidatus Paceibacterota bacterium]
MRLVLVLGLVLVGLLEIPLLSESKVEKEIRDGEVSGVISLASPSSRPSLAPTPTNTPKPTPTPKITLPIIKEIVLLDQEKKLKDEKIEIFIPKLDQSKLWYLELEFDLRSEEDALGFDSPGFTIHLDDQLVYQRSIFETGPQIVVFNLTYFSNNPHLLSLWSGNAGDKLKDTFAIIEKIKLVPYTNHSFIETAAIDDLAITIDNNRYFTLEWSSPKNNDISLGKPLAYEIRYSSESMTLKNWSQAQKTERFLPLYFSPQSPGSKEIILIKTPTISYGYLAIRSIDSAGELSPLGKNVIYKIED